MITTNYKLVKIMYLQEFIKQLENKGLLKFNILGDSDENFNNRFRIQKFVFLARYFGLNFNYNFRIYLHGPYSSHLADDYYNLAKNVKLNNACIDVDTEKFEKDIFLSFVANRDDEWLESSSTILSLADVYSDKKILLNKIYEIKSHINKNIINTIFSELEAKDIIKLGKNAEITDSNLMIELKNSSIEYGDIYEKLAKETCGYNFSI